MGIECAVSTEVPVCQQTQGHGQGALAIVYRTIATHLTRKAGFTKPTAQTGAVTLIQRFGSGNELTQLKKEHGQPLIFPQKPIEA